MVNNERAVKVFPKKRWGEKSKALKCGVNKKKKAQPRRLCILGSGRCGTEWWARAFQHCGYDVLHERTGEHGTSTHFYHSDHSWYPYYPWEKGKCHYGERLSDFDFDRVIHIVRNPLTCIPSIMKIFTTLEWEFAEETGVLPVMDRAPKLWRAMAYWYGVNEAIEKVAYNHEPIQLEDPERWRRMYDIVRGYFPKMLLLEPPIPPKNRGTGYRKSVPISYGELSEVDSVLTRKIWRMATRYGY